MPHGGLCSWPTFHALVTKPQNGNSRARDGSHHNNVSSMSHLLPGGGGGGGGRYYSPNLLVTYLDLFINGF